MTHYLNFPQGLYKKLKADIIATNNHIFIENKQLFLYVINLIYNEMVQKEKDFAYLSSGLLLKNININKTLTYNEILKFLIENNYIKVHSKYSNASHKCNAYSITEKYYNTTIDRITCTHDLLIKRLSSYKNLCKKEYSDLMKILEKNISEVVVNQYFSKKHNIANLILEKDNEEFISDQIVTKGKSSERYYHALTSIPREIKHALEHTDGSRLVELDLSAAHCVWLAKMNKESNLYDEDFSNDVATGVFYENMMKFNKIENTQDNREQVKKDFQKFFINANIIRRKWKNYRTTFLKDTYNNFYKWFLKKFSTVEIVGNVLTKIESYYFNNTFGQFCSDNDIFWITCHDCIIVKQQDVEDVKSYMIDVLDKAGYNFLLKTKEYDFTTIEETEKAILKISRFRIEEIKQEKTINKSKNKQDTILELIRDAKNTLADKSSIRKIADVTGLGISTVAKYIKLI